MQTAATASIHASQSPTSTWSPTASPISPPATHVYYPPVMDQPIALIKKPRKETDSVEEKTKSPASPQIQVIHPHPPKKGLVQGLDWTSLCPPYWNVSHLECENPKVQAFFQEHAPARPSYAILPHSGRKCKQWRQECHQHGQIDQRDLLPSSKQALENPCSSAQFNRLFVYSSQVKKKKRLKLKMKNILVNNFSHCSNVLLSRNQFLFISFRVKSDFKDSS